MFQAALYGSMNSKILFAMSVLTVADRLLMPRLIAEYPAVPLGFFPVIRSERQILVANSINSQARFNSDFISSPS